MVTLQILVLPFLVRVRVSQLKAFIFQRWMLFFVYNKYPILLFLRNFAWNRRSAAFYRKKKDSEDFKKTSVYFNNI